MSLQLPHTNLKLFLTIIASKITAPFEEEDWDAIRFGIQDTERYSYTLFGESNVTFAFSQHPRSQKVEVQFQTETNLYELVANMGRVLEAYSPTSTKRIEALVEEAFAANSHPPTARVTSCTLEHLEICDECQEVMDTFQGKHWKELIANGKEPPYNCAGPCFLTQEARHYYFPAYLITEFREQCKSKEQHYNNIKQHFEDDMNSICHTPIQEALLDFVFYLSSEEYYLRFQR